MFAVLAYISLVLVASIENYLNVRILNFNFQGCWCKTILLVTIWKDLHEFSKYIYIYIIPMKVGKF